MIKSIFIVIEVLPLIAQVYFNLKVVYLSNSNKFLTLGSKSTKTIEEKLEEPEEQLTINLSVATKKLCLILH